MRKSDAKAEKVKKAKEKKKELDREIKKKAGEMIEARRKRRAGITFRLVLLALIPAFSTIGGLLATSVINLREGLQKEAMDGLALLGKAVCSSYEDMKGDFVQNGNTLKKGDTELTINPATLDVYVKDSENDVALSLCYGKRRMLTTLTDNKGVRLTGTDISDEVWDVVKTGKTYRDTSLKIDGKRYCAVYVPLRDNGQVVGCVFAGQPTSDMTAYILNKVVHMLIVGAGILIFVAVIAGLSLSTNWVI